MKKYDDPRKMPLDRCMSLGELMFHIQECKELDKKERSCKTCEYGESIIDPYSFKTFIRCKIHNNYNTITCISYERKNEKNNKKEDFIKKEEMKIE